ncbi:peptidoglycan recognition protein family protein [Serratia proteamaculans]
MFYVDDNGYIDDDRIVVKIFGKIEHGKLDKVNGIVVHQTNGPTASSTFNSYSHDGANGAHFLIDKDGTIYQTASLFKVTWHVGKNRSKCFIEKKCEPAEFKKIAGLEMLGATQKISNLEKKKPFPDRFPNNKDSIEIVGQAKEMKVKDEMTGEKTIYEEVNDMQNASLKWLVAELAYTLNVSMVDIYRHPDIGRKNLTEASTAKW